MSEGKKSNRAEPFSFGAIRFDFDAIRFDFGAIRFDFDAIRFDFDAIRFRFDAIRFCFDTLSINFDTLSINYDTLSINFDTLSIWRCAMSRRETMATIDLTASADLPVGKGGDGITFARCVHVCVRKSGIRMSVKKDE